jgi:Thioredoxin
MAPTCEAFAEEMDRMDSPVTVVSVGCTENKDLCLKAKIQACPTMVSLFAVTYCRTASLIGFKLLSSGRL